MLAQVFTLPLALQRIAVCLQSYLLIWRQQSLSRHFLGIFLSVAVKKVFSFTGYCISRLPRELSYFPCCVKYLQRSVLEGLSLVWEDSSYVSNTRLNQYVIFMIAKELDFLLFLSPAGR